MSVKLSVNGSNDRVILRSQFNPAGSSCIEGDYYSRDDSSCTLTSLSSIVIDGKRGIRGEQSTIDLIFERIQKGSQEGTMQVTLAGKDLTVITGQMG